MTKVPGPGIRWRKARRSDGNDLCIELAHTLAAVRDSKNPAGNVLAVDALALVLAVQAGRLG